MTLKSSYLGTGLPPGSYYVLCGGHYQNPHIQGIHGILALNQKRIEGNTILDLGCGDGLVTKFFSQSMKDSKFIGVDNSDVMLERYKETGFETYKASFGDELPKADTAIACYSLHLCEESKLAQMGVWLAHSGVKKLHVISPIKRPNNILCYDLKDYFICYRGKDLSQIYFKTFELIQ